MVMHVEELQECKTNRAAKEKETESLRAQNNNIAGI